MHRRALAILALAVIVLAARVTSFYATLTAVSEVTASGWTPELGDEGRVLVGRVSSHDAAGHRTPAAAAGLLVGDRIVGMYNATGQGGAIASWPDMSSADRAIHRGDPWVIVVERTSGSGALETLTLPMGPAAADAPANFYNSRLELTIDQIVLPIAALATACLIGLTKPDDDQAFLAALLFVCVACTQSFSIYLPIGLREVAVALWVVSQVFVFYFLMRFFLAFPQRSVVDRRFPQLANGLFAVTAVAFAPSAAYLWLLQASHAAPRLLERLHSWLSPFTVALMWCMGLVGLVALTLSVAGAENRDSRRRLGLLLAGTSIAFVPTLYFLVAVWVFHVPRADFAWWLRVGDTLAWLLFPLTFGYVVLKHRMFGIRLIVRRGLQYLLVSRTFLAVEAVVLLLACLFVVVPLVAGLLPQASVPAIQGTTAVAVLALVGGVRRVNTRVMPAIDRRFFREAYDAQRILTDLARSVRTFIGRPDQLLQTTIEEIGHSLHPDTVAVFIRQAAGPYRCAAVHAAADLIGTDQELDPESAIARYLAEAALEDAHPLDTHPNDGAWAHDERARRLIGHFRAELLVPLVTQRRPVGFLLLGQRLSDEPYSAEDKALLRTVADQLAIAVDYSDLIARAAEQEKVRREIEIATEVQRQLFPQVLPPLETLDYCAVCKPARAVGGDYYDFLSLGGGRELGIAVGDVSGKGISAALLMASLQALLRSHAPIHQKDVARLAADLNRLLFESTAANKYATFFYSVYDEARRTLTCVNAGHNPPLLLRASGSVHRLDVGGPPIGLLSDVTYQQETVQLERGDVIVIFTDGISDAMNGADEDFGDERLCEAVGAFAAGTAVQIRDGLIEATERFVGEAPQHDDMTVVVARIV